MPATLNGIGTRYWGKRNLRLRPGVCERCHRSVSLHSYETRLWVTVFFLPVVPLGRKQVLDECPRCTRHRVMSLKQWERQQQEVRDRTRAAMEAAPDEAEPMMVYQRVLAEGGLYADASGVAEELEARFGDRAEVQLFLGGWHEYHGRREKADVCFEKALSLEPENNDARRAVAAGCIDRGEVGRAAELVSQMEASGADSGAGVLVMLGHGYQGEGEHSQALDCFRKAYEADASLARDRSFRKSVKRSERMTYGEAPVLPPAPFCRRGSVLAGAAGLIVAGMVLCVNHFIATHRTLHIVNGLGEAAEVRVDGGKVLPVSGHFPRKVSLAEGAHRAEVTVGDVTETVEFTMRTGWLDRFLSQPVFVLNIRGAAAVAWEETVYTPHSKARLEAAPWTVHVGDEAVVIAHADYPFAEFPKVLQRESEQEFTRSRVFVVDGEPGEIAREVTGVVPGASLMRYAESHLERRPDDCDLLDAYVEAGREYTLCDRCREFLGRWLEERPVRMEWHRHYQMACRAVGRGEALVGQYDAMVAAEPESGALLYLRGRLATTHSEALRFAERAKAAEPSNPYPWRSVGWVNLARGDLEAAREPLTEALRLDPGNRQVGEMLFRTRAALGELDALEAETREALAEAPLDWDLYDRLVSVLVAKGDDAGALAAHEAYAERLREAYPEGWDETVVHSHLRLLDLQGRSEEALEKVGELSDPSSASGVTFRAHLRLGQLAVLEESCTPADYRNGILALTMSLGWLAKGDDEKASLWRKRAVQAFAEGTTCEKRVAALLESGPRVSVDEACDLDLDPVHGCLLLTALAAECPAHREHLLAEARKRNFACDLTHGYMRRFIEAVGSLGTPPDA